MARQLAIEIFLAAAIGAALGLIGPFDTYGFGAGLRMAYWVSFVMIGYAIFRPLIIVSGWLADQTGMSAWAARSLALLLASLPMALLVAWMINGFDLGRALHQPGLPVFYAQVLAIGVVVNFIYITLFGPSRSAVATVPTVEPPLSEPAPASLDAAPLAALFARLPTGFGGVIALRSEDHYVRVYAPDRDTLILIRLRDAIAELGDTQGAQVHRSWWVARSAVVARENDGRNIKLVLTGGLKVPVSRDGAAMIKARGW